MPVSYQSKTKFSIIVPARNEENNITACLLSILNQEYNRLLFEIIVVDDHSIDGTSAEVEKLQQQYANLRLIRLADELDGEILNSYKKKAIEIAIEKATGDWIITTDADCTVTKHWLALYDAYIQQNNLVFVAAPVVFIKQKTILSLFQFIDFATLQGITAASVSAGFHSMCNGANIAYKKSVFYEVNGFKFIDNIASGDDMLLMNKIKQKYPSKIGYLFSNQAVVATLPMPDWRSFYNQRIRWASKADKYKDKTIFSVLLLVYCLNVCLFIIPVVALFNWQLWLYWFFFIALKTIVELSFAKPVGKFFGQSFMWWFPLLQPLHICYTVIAGWLGKFGKYKWKGRNVK